MSNQPQIEHLEKIASGLMKAGHHEQASLIHSAINLLDQVEDLERQLARVNKGASGFLSLLFGRNKAAAELEERRNELLGQAHDLLDQADV